MYCFGRVRISITSRRERDVERERCREREKDERLEKAKMFNRFIYTGAMSIYCGIEVTTSTSSVYVFLRNERWRGEKRKKGGRTEMPRIERKKRSDHISPIYPLISHPLKNPRGKKDEQVATREMTI